MASCNMVAGNIMVTPFAPTPPITDVIGMGCVTEITGNVNISDVDELPNFDGMEALTSIGGDLKIWGNDALIDLSGLSGLTHVGGSIEIRVNESLCQSAVDALIEGLSSYGGPVDTDGNADC